MSEHSSNDRAMWWKDSVACCRAQLATGCGSVREGVPDSTAAAFTAMAEETRLAAPWRYVSDCEWLRLDGLEPWPLFVSLAGRESGARSVSIVLASAEGQPASTGAICAEDPRGPRTLHVLYPGDSQGDLEVAPCGASAGKTGVPSPAAVAMNAGRSGADSLATREELLICINVLRMLSLVPLADGVPFKKRFVNRNGSEAFVTWPHGAPADAG